MAGAGSCVSSSWGSDSRAVVAVSESGSARVGVFEQFKSSFVDHDVVVEPAQCNQVLGVGGAAV